MTNSKPLFFVIVLCCMFLGNFHLAAQPIDIILSSLQLNEGIPAQNAVAVISTTSNDNTATYNYQLVAGEEAEDNSFFTISNNLLIITHKADFETKKKYSIRLKTEDENGLSFSKSFEIKVNDLQSPKFETTIYTKVSPVNNIYSAANAIWIASGSGAKKLSSDGTSLKLLLKTNGLAGNTVNDIAIETDGAIWLATSSGVTEINGDNSQSYHKTDGLADDKVTALAIDINNNKWFATWGQGLSKFDGTSWTTYTTTNGLVDNYIYDIEADSEGRVWIGTSAGVSLIDGNNIQNYTKADGLIHGEVYSIAIANDHKIWMATWKGVSSFDGNSWESFLTDDGLVDNFVLEVAAGSDGSLWFATLNGVASYINEEWTTYTTDNGLADNQVSAIAIDDEHHVWIATEAGLQKFNGTDFINITISDNIGSNETRSIAVNSKDEIWLATWGGVSYYKDNNWNNITTDDGIVDNVVNDVAFDSSSDEHIWIATSRGLSFFDGTLWNNYTTIHGLPSNNIRSVSVDKNGDLWAGTWGGGVSRYKNQQWKDYQQIIGLADNFVNCVETDSYNNKWFGTANGLSKYDGSNWTNYTTANGMPNNNVKSIAFTPQGALWIASWGGGVALFDNDKWTSYTVADGLLSNNVNAVYVDREGHLWAGTDKGLSKYADNAFRNYTRADGLISDNIYAINQDAEGRLWVATSAGIAIVVEVNNAPTDILFSNLRVDEGIAANETLGYFTTSDTDVDDPAIYTFAIGNGINDADNSKFVINANSLIAKQPVDFENQSSYHIVVEANDTYGGSIKKAFEIKVNNRNDNSPITEQAEFTIDEHTPEQTFVGQILASDADNDLLTYNIIGGNVQQAFAIDGSNGKLSVANRYSINYETIYSFNLEIEVSDGEHKATTYAIVYLNNIIEDALNVYDNQFTIVENPIDNAIVGQVYVAGGQSITYDYSIVSGNQFNAFVMDSKSGQLFVNNVSAFDYEQILNYVLEVKVSDGLTSDRATIIVQIDNVNDNPPIVNNTTLYIDENTKNASVVANIQAADPDGNISPIRYSLKNTDPNSAFAIDEAKGKLVVNNVSLLDYEQVKTMILTVEVSDGIYTDDAIINIKINNLNDSKPQVENIAYSIPENSPAYTVVGSINANDPDNDNNTLSYSIEEGNAGKLFSINQQTGLVTVNKTIPAFEQSNIYLLNVRISDGLNYCDTIITINILNAVNVSSLKKSAATIAVFPNPTTTFVNIDCSKLTNVDNITILDMQGKKMMSIDNLNHQLQTIDVSDWQSAFYIVKVATKETIYTHKFIVRK